MWGKETFREQRAGRDCMVIVDGGPENEEEIKGKEDTDAHVGNNGSRVTGNGVDDGADTFGGLHAPGG